LADIGLGVVNLQPKSDAYKAASERLSIMENNRRFLDKAKENAAALRKLAKAGATRVPTATRFSRSFSNSLMLFKRRMRILPKSGAHDTDRIFSSARAARSRFDQAPGRKREWHNLHSPEPPRR
jgi:hypothetical protein